MLARVQAFVVDGCNGRYASRRELCNPRSFVREIFHSLHQEKVVESDGVRPRIVTPGRIPFHRTSVLRSVTLQPSPRFQLRPYAHRSPCHHQNAAVSQFQWACIVWSLASLPWAHDFVSRVRWYLQCMPPSTNIPLLSAEGFRGPSPLSRPDTARLGLRHHPDRLAQIRWQSSACLVCVQLLPHYLQGPSQRQLVV